MSALTDFNFTLTTGDCELTNITEVTIFCEQAQAVDYSYCSKVAINSFEFFIPKPDDSLADKQPTIRQILGMFVAERYAVFHSKYVQDGYEIPSQEDLFTKMMNLMSYSVKGFEKTGSGCKSTDTLLDREENERTIVIQNLKKEFVKSEKWAKDLAVVKENMQKTQKLKKKAKIYDVKMTKIEDQEYLEILFTKDMVFLNQNEISQLSQHISIFVISGQYRTKGRLKSQLRNLQNENDLQFQWDFAEQKDKSILISITFDDPKRVSQDISGRDQLELSISENNFLRDQQHDLNIIESYNTKYYATLTQQRVEDSNLLVNDNVLTGQTILTLLIEANMLILNLFLSKSLQDVWALLSTSQITTHMMLLKCSTTAPANIYKYNNYISQFTQKDMYPTDEIFGYFFNFTDSDSPIEYFEDLGYEGANFVDLTGSLIINIVLVIAYGIIQWVLFFFAKKLYMFEIVREQRLKIQRSSAMATILGIFLQGFLETFICAVISIWQVREQELYQTNSDVFSLCFASLSLLILAVLPIGMMYWIYKNLEEHKQNLEPHYEFMYTDLSLATFWSSIFNIIFMIRRALFALILIFLQDYTGIQLICHTFITLFYTVYILWFKPYKGLSQNNMQVFNEVSVLLVTYVLIAIIFLYEIIAICNDNLKVETKYVLGYFYIFFSSFNILYNIYNMVYDVFTRIIPLKRQKRKIIKEQKEYEKWILRWVNEKEPKDSDDKMQKQIYEHAKLMIFVRDKRKQLINFEKRYNRQLEWLKENQLPIDVMLKQKKDILFRRNVLKESIQKLQLENKKQGIKLGESIGGLNSLMYSLKNVKGDDYPHLRDQPLQNLQQDIIRPFLDANNLSKASDIWPSLQGKLDSIILAQKLKLNRYHLYKVKPDGNCGPRCIAFKVYGDQKYHPKVRLEIMQYMQCQHEFWGKQRGTNNFKQFIFQKLQHSGEWFTDTEFKAAAKLYNFPIILFSKSGTLINEAFTQEGNGAQPLYVLHKNNHFDVLIHREDNANATKGKPFMARRVPRKLEVIQEKDEEEQ